MDTTPKRTGACLCGAVTYEIAGPARQVVACHCSQCRKQSGHYVSATQVPMDALTIAGAENLTWYAASDSARRGFCKTCGSQLFWEPAGRATMSIFAGTLDAPTGLTTVAHIFVADKGDYYEIGDGPPQYDVTIAKDERAAMTAPTEPGGESGSQE
ncbi:hypothetical protein GGD81_003092 [Rhodobium orientis]|uniref:Aldehyde-activating protein n=1 Tax=Rhodobium orientis TaxID=34017 RepID=A0A327JVG3_9HYPH|nr:GFA family protein [Rhodobium orientis]MBB4304037.1 hypothetical protein [Rhodobium orientis]MBK5950754.1 aldehyde-activating protein [Rhodobium orientis]RAI29575.1 aldehyde-activating protein [Rhodobium orientis]